MGGTAGQRRAEKAERDQAKQETVVSSKKKAEDDAYWAAAGDGSKSKAAARREASDAASDAAAAKRAEAKRLAQLEEEEMANLGKPKAKGGAKKKLTKAEIKAAEEADALARAKARFAKAKELKKEVSEETYAATVDVKNENANETIDASGVDAAVDAMKVLTTGGDAFTATPVSTNMKAAFAAFQEVELPKLKVENPRLKKSQYDEQLSKMWKKDPRNPQNFPKE
jgi:hypothetical protein